MTRAVLILQSMLLALLATMSRVFFPTEPVGAWGLRLILLSYAIAFAVQAWRPFAPKNPWLRGLSLVPLLAILGMMSAYGVTIALIFFRLQLAGIATLVLAGLMTLAWRIRQGMAPPRSLAVPATLTLFVCASCFTPLCMWMWAAPPEGACKDVSGQEAVTCLTPEAYQHARSYPYRLAYIPETQRIIGAFKMGGNLAIGPWDDPEANRLAVIDVSEPRAPVRAVLPLEGDPLPQYMAVAPDGRSLIVDRLGYERHLLDYVDLSDFPTLRLSQRVETVEQPHAILDLADGRLALATLRREMMLLDRASGEVRTARPIQTWLATPGFTLTDMIMSPYRKAAFLAMFGTDIVAFDLSDDALEMSTRRVGFGAGMLAHDPATPRLYQTDFFTNTLRVIDTKRLEVTHELSLDYTPRPVAVSDSRDLIAIGEWIEGVIHFRRRSTLAPIERSVRTGPYLRDLVIDGEHGLLFAATKCGVVMVDLAAIGL